VRRSQGDLDFRRCGTERSAVTVPTNWFLALVFMFRDLQQ